MNKRYIILIIVLAFLLLSIFNSTILPTRTEITDVEMTNVIGLDVYGENYEMTIVRSNSKPSGTGENTGQSIDEETISVAKVSYIEDLLSIQTISDKYLNTSHTNFYLVGEQSVNSDLKHIIDFIGRNYQTRLNANIFIVRASNTREFLEKLSDEKFKISDKLDNMEYDFETKSITKMTMITDVIDILMKDKMDGVIPTVKLVDKDKEKIATSKNALNYKAPFAFDGLAVIKNAKIVGYLNKEETKAYNYVMDEISDFYLFLSDKEAQILFGIKGLETNIKFAISENGKINKIIFNTEFKSSFEEVKADINVFNEKNTNKYKSMEEEKVKEQIHNIVKKSINMDVDFLELEENLRLKHPYKYRKMKGDVWQNIKRAEICVVVKSNLKTTFDIIETNKNQIGE